MARAAIVGIAAMYGLVGLIAVYWLADRLTLVAVAPNILFCFAMTYAFLRLRRWSWVLAVASNGVLLAGAFLVFVVMVQGLLFGVTMVQGLPFGGPLFTLLWLLCTAGPPACLLGVCLAPSVRSLMVR